MPQHRFPVRLWAAQDLDAGGVLTSGVIDCRKADPEGMLFRVTNAGGDASVQIQVAFSNDGTTFNDYAAQEDLVEATLIDWAGTAEEYHMVGVPWAPFIRLKVTELASLADNVIDADLWMTEL